jgi:hypothetical protein
VNKGLAKRAEVVGAVYALDAVRQNLFKHPRRCFGLLVRYSVESASAKNVADDSGFCLSHNNLLYQSTKTV